MPGVLIAKEGLICQVKLVGPHDKKAMIKRYFELTDSKSATL